MTNVAMKIDELFDEIFIQQSKRIGSCVVCGEWDKSHHYFKEFNVAVCPCLHASVLTEEIKELMKSANFRVEDFKNADELEWASANVDASSICEGYNLWNLHFMNLGCINEFLSKLKRPLVAQCSGWECETMTNYCCENFGRHN
jgi:hypothetical protein